MSGIIFTIKYINMESKIYHISRTVIFFPFSIKYLQSNTLNIVLPYDIKLDTKVFQLNASRSRLMWIPPE